MRRYREETITNTDEETNEDTDFFGTVQFLLFEIIQNHSDVMSITC